MTGLKVWNGTAFVDGAPKIWDGSAFVDPDSAYIWDGSAFVKVWSAIVPPAFDAAGGGTIQPGTSLSWSHTATAGAYALVFIQGIAPSSVTYGGVAMTLLGSASSVSGADYLYGLSGVAGGAQTITANFSSSRATGGSVSYTNVASVGAPATSGPAFGASASQAMTCAANQIIVQAFGSSSALTSASGGNVRFISSAVTGNVAIQDSTTSTTFTAAKSGGGNFQWGGIGVVLS